MYSENSRGGSRRCVGVRARSSRPRALAVRWARFASLIPLAALFLLLPPNILRPRHRLRPQLSTPRPSPRGRSSLRQQLDQLAARIALYPDPLLAQILTAATYWSEIPEAAAWEVWRLLAPKAAAEKVRAGVTRGIPALRVRSAAFKSDPVATSSLRACLLFLYPSPSRTLRAEYRYGSHPPPT